MYRSVSAPRPPGRRHHGLARLLPLSILIFAATAGADTNCVNYRNLAYGAGSAETGSEFSAVAVSGSVAYTIVYSSNLQTFDCSVPDSPRQLARVNVSGNRAYVAGGAYQGFAVVNVTSPTAPSIMGYVSMPGFARALAVDGTVAYVACHTAGLQMVSIADPAHPALLGNVAIPSGALKVAVVAPYAYVTNDNGNLYVVDVQVPTAPVLVNTVAVGGHLKQIRIVGSLAYVGDSSYGLVVVDIADRANPHLLGRGQITSYASGLAVLGNRAYVANSSSPLQVFDITDPSQPRLERTIWMSGAAYGACASGRYVYVANGWRGLQMIDTEYVPPSGIRGVLETPGRAVNVAIEGTRAYVADGTHGLLVAGLNDPQQPQLLGRVDTRDEALDVAAAGAHAYVADRDGGLRIIDVSDPFLPREVGGLDTPGMASGIAVRGSIAYVADGGSGLMVVDVMDPESPRRLGSVDTPGYACSVAVSGSRVYVADYNKGVQVVDVTIPERPLLITGEFPGIAGRPCVDVAVSDGVLAVASGYDSVRFYSIDPWLDYGYLNNGSAYASSVALAGDVAFVASYAKGLVVVDITDPHRPLVMGIVDTPGAAMGVATHGTQVVVADELLGLDVMAAHCGGDALTAVEPELSRRTPLLVVPNPTTGRARFSGLATKPGLATVHIYDVRGRLVRKLDLDLSAGQDGFEWDGRDGSGHQVGAGVYLARVRALGLEADARVVVLR